MKSLWNLLIIGGLIVINCLVPLTGYAETKEDLAEAEKLLLAASASVASYNYRAGRLAFEYLEQNGWDLKPYKQSTPQVEADFLSASKASADGHYIYLLALTGTESLKDVKTDLRFDKIYFAGRTPEEMAENAKLSHPSNDLPKVHRGFYQYMHAALTARPYTENLSVDKYLSQALLDDPASKIYIVGHSLGGAAATLEGAALINMGIKPDQIEVISFGAPAVGNEAFKQKYEPMLNLKRVVIDGDPVTGILQGLAGGYKQFGREIRWDSSSPAGKGPHTMVEYLDLAIKNYYYHRNLTKPAGETASITKKLGTRKNLVYIAPLIAQLPEPLTSEAWYMQEAVADQYSKTLPEYIIADKSESTAGYLAKAAAENCKWLLTQELSGYKLKDKPNEYYITLTQTIRSVDTGEIVYIASNSTGTNKLTPLEALLHDARNMGLNIAKWINDQN